MNTFYDSYTKAIKGCKSFIFSKRLGLKPTDLSESQPQPPKAWIKGMCYHTPQGANILTDVAFGS